VSILESLFSIVATTAAVAGIVFAYLQWKKTELRRDEVFLWSCEVIKSMQSLAIFCNAKSGDFDDKFMKDKIEKIKIETSIHIEVGRIFFKNTLAYKHGTNKESAYRGLRPEILDAIVTAHQIAMEWPISTSDRKRMIGIVAQKCVREFVSLAQKEVGRSRSVSREASQAGQGGGLAARLKRLDGR